MKKISFLFGFILLLFMQTNIWGKTTILVSTSQTYRTIGSVYSTGIITGAYAVARNNGYNLTTNPYGTTSSMTPTVQNINEKTLYPNTYTILSQLPTSISVGTGETYTSLTGSSGLFAAINSGVLVGNTTVTIKSNLTEDGATALNQWSEEGGSGYTLTIQSDGTARTISGTLTKSMIKINGADRLTIDGGSSKLLTFRNTTTGNTRATFEFTNDSKNCTVRNCTIENNSPLTTLGNIVIGTAGIDTNLVTIESCNIGNATGGTTGNSVCCIYSNYARNKITVINCNIYNFTNYGCNFPAVADSCTISGNSFYNNSSPSTLQYSIYITSSSSGNHCISGNYIGGQASQCGGSAWTNSGAVDIYGLYLTGQLTKPLLVQNNIIKNFSLTSTTSGHSFTGICGNSCVASIKSNTIDSITIATTSFNGISVNISTNYSTVEGNVISDINCTNTTGTPNLSGINAYDADIRKNKIYKLTATSTGAPIIYGIKKNSSSEKGNEISNNQICLNGGSATNPIIYGIYNTPNTFTDSVFYNTVLINGSVVNTSNSTYAFWKNGGTIVLKNNILINNRTNGTSQYNYSFYSLNASSLTSNYNFLATADTSSLCYFGSSRVSFYNLKKNYGKDTNSWCYPTGSSPLLEPANLFTDYANGNLNIASGNVECWFVNGKGYPISTISTDYSGNTRSTAVAGSSTDIGANEFTPTIAPPSITLTPVQGLNTFSYAGRTLATVNFTTATLPTTLSLSYWSGKNPPNPNGQTGSYGNSYFEFITAGTNSGLNYTLVLYFDSREQYSIANISNLGMSKSTNGGTEWNPVSGTTYTAGPPATVTATGQTSFSYFTFTSTNSPLPVELNSFSSNVNNKDIKLLWTTSKEINNVGFEIQRQYQVSGIKHSEWEKKAFVTGNGTKSTPTNYSYTDKKLNTGKYNYRLKQIDNNGNFSYFNLSNTVEIGLPLKYNLSQNYPNPFNPTTKIDYELPYDSKVKILIYDDIGRK